MKSEREKQENVNQEDFPTDKPPYLTGESNTDWSLWQLVQALKEIAQSTNRNRNNELNIWEESDDETR
ncbi:hypothetical protein ACFLXO_04480 [Chloroflexota bacterium]